MRQSADKAYGLSDAAWMDTRPVKRENFCRREAA